jgi:hypothetical protein
MQSAAPSRLSRNTDGLFYTGDILTYRITGLTTYNLDRLKVNLKAYVDDAPGTSHIDTFDLYHSRSRESFSESCAKYLKVAQPAIMTELSELIAVLEQERIDSKNDTAKPDEIAMSDEEKEAALTILKSKDLLQIFLSLFDSLGYIGEEKNKLIGVIAVTSRLLADPVSLLFLARSGAGKTGIQNAICKTVPPEHLIQNTRLTGQSLFYREENALKNKVLAIEEDGGMESAMYSIRTMISSQQLSLSTTRTDPKTGKMTVDEYMVKGPLSVFISTTNPAALDDETRQRFLILTIDESQEQTQKILQAQRTKNTLSWYQLTCNESTVARQFHNMQRMLKPYTVVFPDNLKVFWPYGMLQMRREQGKFISLVKAITLLHQYQRKAGTLKRADNTVMEYVQATEGDVELALTLCQDVFARNVDDVSPQGRNLLKNIVDLTKIKLDEHRERNPKSDLQMSQIPFTRKELRLLYGWTNSSASRMLEHLTELGYLGQLGGKQGSTCRYVLLDTGEDDPMLEFRMSQLEESGWQQGGKNKKSMT